MRVKWWAFLAAVGVLLMSGCGLDATVGVTLDADGAGEFSVSVEPDRELAREAGAAGFDVVDELASTVGTLEGWEASRVGGGIVLSTDFTDPEDLRTATGSFAEALAAPVFRPLEPVEVELTDDHVRFATRAGLEVTGTVEELAAEPAQAHDLLAESVSFTYRVVMPGEVVAHNADSRDGTTLTWDVPAGERIELHAEAERPGWNWELPVLAMALAAVVALAAILIVRRRG